MEVNFCIDGRYEVKEPLGQGGMGIVYRTYDMQRKGYVALKTMKDAANPAALELFAQEWRTLANISHPNIVDVLDSGEFEEDGQRKPYFVMPLLPGRTLDKLIRDTGHKLTVDRVVEILYQTCRGLQAAHTNGLIHRDLKPSNLFVLSDDSVKIIDFGMVHLTDVTKSATGIKGTLQYMAPEQLEMKEITAATDIFSLGAVAYESLTGRQPFDRGSAGATAHAIRYEFPPPVSELNPAVNKTLAQVIAKAMAKGPWNRFTSAREFGEHLQHAGKGEPIEAFELGRIQPRIERARRALNEGDLEYADEILNELQLEGHVDSEITVLLDQVKEAARNKAIHQLLESARTRLQEEEYPLAWQKVQEALQRDPANAEAHSLQAEIETRRSDQKMEKWRRLVHQHLHNNAFSQARQAVEEIRKVGRDDIEVLELIRTLERRESEFQKASAEKEQHFQSAVRAYESGEIGTALSKLRKILEPEGPAAGFSLPGRDQLYRETYEKVRSEWEAVQHAVAEIGKVIAAGDLVRAVELSGEQSAKYPNDFALQALKLKLEDQLRQEKSAYVAEIARRLDAEPDLDRAVQVLEEAREKYPKEPHFQELAVSMRKRRDFVNSIVHKARQYEEQNLVSEALSQWNALRSIHPRYPGLDFEIARVENRCEQQDREEAKLSWVSQIDRLLQNSDFEKAHSLAVEALSSFPKDYELETLLRLAQEGRERRSEGTALSERAKGLLAERHFSEAIEVLRRAMALDGNNPAIRTALADAFAAEAQKLLPGNWVTAEPLVQEALHIAPSHALAKSLRPSILLAKRIALVDRLVAEARERQAAGDLEGALAKVEDGLASYPNDSRLVQLRNTLRNTTAEQATARRNRDLQELRQISKQAAETGDEATLSMLLERSAVLERAYPGDQEISTVACLIQDRGRRSAPPGPERPIKTNEEPPCVPTSAPTPAVPGGAPVSPTSSAAVAGLSTRKPWYPLSSLKRLPRTYPIALAGILLLIGIPVAFLRGCSHSPPTTALSQVERIQFSTNLEGATLTVDGEALTGNTARLKAGTHKVTAAKLGYKLADRQFTVGQDPPKIDLRLEPEASAIRVSADLPSGKVFLDGAEAGVLQDGNFSQDITVAGKHILKVMDGKNELLSVEFQVNPGAPAQLTRPPFTRDIPVIVVSNLGSHARVHTSSTAMQASLNNGELHNVPSEGQEFTLASSNNELRVTDGKTPATISLENGNAPVLLIRAGTTNKGTLRIEANVEDAMVWINGRKSSRRLQRGVWLGQYDQGEYKVRLGLDGYDEMPERKLTVAAGKTLIEKFELKPSVTSAFLKIQGGTPDAEVLLDGNPVGRLDSSGTLGLIPMAPDIDHAVRIQKESFEPAEWKRRAPLKETAIVSGGEARLKPFGTLVLEVQPADAQVSIHRGSETARRVSDKTLSLREGTYTVTASGDGDHRFERFQKDVQIVSGQRQVLQVTLTPKPEASVAPPRRAAIMDLFTDDPKKWTADDEGFWFHDGVAWMKQLYFTHVFDILKVKKTFGRLEKPHWLIYSQGNDYIECELDGTQLSRRAVRGGKAREWVRTPHGAGQADYYRLRIAVEPERVTLQIGKATDTFAAKIEGRTGFTGKFRMRLVE